MTRAIIYARVSTDEQKTNTSLTSQIKRCREYAEHSGLEVVAEFQENYSGATPFEERPEGSKAYSLLKAGGADALVCICIDRFVRPPDEGDEWEVPNTLRAWNKMGVALHTVEEGQVKTDFIGLLTVVMKAKGAGEERRKIRERTRQGMKDKARERRQVVGAGYPPYGFAYQRAEVRPGVNKPIGLQPLDPEAGVVFNIYVRYVQGGASIHAITRDLTLGGVLPPAARYGERYSGRGRWDSATVARILSNPVYKGEYHYHHSQADDIVVAVPAIVPRSFGSKPRINAS